MISKRISTTKLTISSLLFGGVFTTIVINPWTNYDPINLPKLTALFTLAAFLVPVIISRIPVSSLNLKYQLPFYLLLPISLGISFWKNGAPRIEQVWGTWGRNTGIVALVSLYIICFATSTVAKEMSLETFQRIFQRLGYFITCYTTIQLLELDPIAWSQKLMFATFGNLNFMSAFLGLTSVSMIASLTLSRNWSTKIFYVSITTLNIYLIWTSESIQGIAIIIVGITVILMLRAIRKFNRKFFSLSLVSTIVLGGFVAVGSAGVGPLGKWLIQETVIYRIDYWKAALNMIKTHPFTGIGVDSYGDFYREYREADAVLRTGPSRVSNTAHNIFLDYASGAGIFAALSLFGLFFLAFLIFYIRQKKGLMGNEDFVLLPLLASFFIFCLISINQLGVTIWGFIIIGYSLGLSVTNSTFAESKIRRPRSLSASSKGHMDSSTLLTVKRSSSSSMILLPVSIMTGAIAFIFSMIPVRADAKFLTVFLSKEISNDLLQVNDFSTFHREKLIEMAISNGNDNYVLPATRDLLRFNPRSFYGLSVLAFSNSVTEPESSSALEALVELDPHNLEIKRELESRTNTP